ncbi:hypothetical protein D3C87_2068320 [compost metagenome]
MAAPQNTQVDLRRPGTFDDGGLGSTDIERQCVEEVLIDAVDAVSRQAFGEDAGQAMDALGDALESFGAVIHRIKTGDIGQ